MKNIDQGPLSPEDIECREQARQLLQSGNQRISPPICVSDETKKLFEEFMATEASDGKSVV